MEAEHLRPFETDCLPYEEVEFNNFGQESGLGAGGDDVREALSNDKHGLGGGCRKALKGIAYMLAVLMLFAAAFGAGYELGSRRHSNASAAGGPMHGETQESNCRCSEATASPVARTSPPPHPPTPCGHPPLPPYSPPICTPPMPPPPPPTPPLPRQPCPLPPSIAPQAPPELLPEVAATESAKQQIQKTLDQMLMVLAADFSEISGGSWPSYIRSSVHKTFLANATLDSGDNITWAVPDVMAAVQGGYNERALYGPFYWYGAGAGDLRGDQVNSRRWSIDPEQGVAVLWSDGRRSWSDGSPFAAATVARIMEIPGTGWRVSHLLRGSDFRSSRAWGRFHRIKEYYTLVSSPPGTTVAFYAGSPDFTREYLLTDRLEVGFVFKGADGREVGKEEFIARGAGADPVAPPANDATGGPQDEVQFAMQPGGKVIAWRDGAGAVVYSFDDIGVRIARATMVWLPPDSSRGD